MPTALDDRMRLEQTSVVLALVGLLIVVEHVCQNILRVLKPLGHLGVVAVQCLVQRHRRPLASLVHVRHKAVFGVQ